MKNILLILLVTLFVFPACTSKTSEITSTFYLIRHAEKDRSNASNKDPQLTKKGLQRANHWATHFKDIKFDAVYTTNYNRTKETALPTANANNLELSYYNPSDLQIEDFLAKNKGKTVLIVGHSNTTPKFTNELLGENKYKDIADDNNSNLYKVTLKENSKSSELISVD